MDGGAAMLAMHRVGIMQRQAAPAAGLAHLDGPEQHLRQPQEQGHAADHHHDRDHPPQRSGQGDVAEAGGGQRGHGEIERVGIVLDLRVGSVLGGIDQPGHHEDEHQQVEGRAEHILIAAEEGEILAQPPEQLVGVQKAQRPHHAQEAKALAGERRERIEEQLALVNLSDWADSPIDALSGGMQQRVGLARALANDPSVMLMDEAFSALDPLIRTEMQDELLTLQREHKRTIIFISHDLDEAMRIGDRIAIMEGGIVVQVGTPEEILNNPANDYVKSFFRGVDVSTILTAKDIVVKRQVTVIEREGVGLKTALNRLRNEDREYGYIVGDKLDFHGIISVYSVDKAIKSGADKLSAAFLPDINAVAHDTQLSDLIGTVAHTPCGVPVINENGKYLGVINRANLLATLDREGDGANG